MSIAVYGSIPKKSTNCQRSLALFRWQSTDYFKNPGLQSQRFHQQRGHSYGTITGALSLIPKLWKLAVGFILRNFQYCTRWSIVKTETTRCCHGCKHWATEPLRYYISSWFSLQCFIKSFSLTYGDDIFQILILDTCPSTLHKMCNTAWDRKAVFLLKRNSSIRKTAFSVIKTFVKGSLDGKQQIYTLIHSLFPAQIAAALSGWSHRRS